MYYATTHTPSRLAMVMQQRQTEGVGMHSSCGSGPGPAGSWSGFDHGLNCMMPSYLQCHVAAAVEVGGQRSSEAVTCRRTPCPRPALGVQQHSTVQ
jgi:hypothetical protein